MPSTKVSRKASLVNNNARVFGSSPGNGKHIGRSLEMREGKPYPNQDPFQHKIYTNGMWTPAQQLSLLHREGLFFRNKLTGGVGRHSVMYNSQLRW